MKEKCRNCGEVLLFGKRDQKIAWCPKCENIETIPLEKSLEIIRAELRDIDNKIEENVCKFNKECFLISLYITREGLMHDKFLRMDYFMSITELLRKIIDMNFEGKDNCDPMSDDFQALLRYSEKLNENKIVLRLLLNGWSKIIRVRNRQMPDYCFELDKALKIDCITRNFESDDWELALKFTSEWYAILDNFFNNGLYPKNAILDNNIEFYSNKLRLNEFWNTLRVKITLELSSGDPQILQVESLKNVQGNDIINYLRIIDEIIANYPFSFEICREEGAKKFKLSPADFVNFLLPFAKNGFPIDKFKEFFISFPFEYKCFCSFFVTSKGLFVGSQTLKIVSSFLKAKYYRDYLTGNHEIGDEFEDLVAEELEKIKISIADPLHPGKKLRKIRDNEKEPKLEIDMLASVEGCLFVIDCKAMVVSTDFINNSREDFVKSNLKDQIEKQANRISFIKNNMDKLGFDPLKYNTIKNVIVTYNKEPVNRIGDMHIVCVRELTSLLKI